MVPPHTHTRKHRDTRSLVNIVSRDVAVLLVLGVICAVIQLFKSPCLYANDIHFNLWRDAADDLHVDERFAYPKRDKMIVTSKTAAVVTVLCPIAVYLLLQVKLRNIEDARASITGHLFAIAWSTLFTLFFKWLVCGLRPHFLDVCKPDLSRVERVMPHYHLTGNGYGFDSRMHTRAICTFNKTSESVGLLKALVTPISDLDNAMASFPSGHASNSFAAFIFLALYTAGKLRTAQYKNQWKVLLTLSPIITAVVISCSVLIDHYHNWYDVLLGGVLGATCGWFAYQSVFERTASGGKRGSDWPIGAPEWVPVKVGSTLLGDRDAQLAA